MGDAAKPREATHLVARGHVPAVSLITLALTLCVLMMVQMAAESAVACLVLAFFFWYTFAVKRLGACAEGGGHPCSHKCCCSMPR